MCEMFIKIIILFIQIVNVCRGDDNSDAWDSFQRSFVHKNREELVVANVTAKKVIILQSNVNKWKSITIGPICYSVGLSNNGIEMLKSVVNENKTDFKIKTQYEATEHKPNDAVIFHNRMDGQSTAIAIVSFFNQNKLRFLSISHNRAAKSWFWTLEDKIQHINCFKMKNRNIIFIATNTKQGFLYEINVKSDGPNKWFLQNISLNASVTASAFNNFKGDHYMSILQNNQNFVEIYKFENNQFRQHSIIKSVKATYVTSFDVGFKSFLAISGYEACIYEFSKNGVKKQTIENGNLKGVTFWLPIPIQNYRDEVLLLAQRSVHHGTHFSNEVEVFTYNGNKFEEHEDISCYMHEESISRLRCLTQNFGIMGSSFLVVENTVALIVPKSNKSAELFMINIITRKIPNPKETELKELLKIKKKLEISLFEQEKRRLDKVVMLTNASISEHEDKDKIHDPIVGDVQTLQNISAYLTEVENIEAETRKLCDTIENITKYEKNIKFNDIIINGNVFFKNGVVVKEAKIDSINGQKTTDLLKDIVRKDNVTDVLKNKTFTDQLWIDDLKCNRVNDFDATNIVFEDEQFIQLNGNITFKKPSEIKSIHLLDGIINDFSLENDTFTVGKEHRGTLKFEEIKVENNLGAAKINNVTLRTFPTARNHSEDEDTNLTDLSEVHIPKNLSVSFINSENLTNFFESLCLINTNCFIPGSIRISGKVNASEVTTDYLNNVKFPEEYILQNSQSVVNITGKKNFVKTLTAEKIVAESINGIKIDHLITLSTKQNLGNKTFKHFGITHELKPEGDIVGNFVKNFLSNPTLEETNTIKANVSFNDLEINGNIFIEDNFNGQDYRQLLTSLLYDDDLNAVITSDKKFTKGLNANRLTIESGSINKVDVSSMMTQDTNQNLTLNILYGNVQIDQLVVDGTFDGKIVSKLNESLLELTGNHSTNATLSFDDLEVGNLEISGKLNDVDVDEILNNIDSRRVIQNISFDHLIVENMIVNGNITGNITGFNLQDFNENMLSLTKNQTIRSHYHINGSKVDHLIVEKINGSENKLILSKKEFLQGLNDAFDDEKLTVENLFIKDSIDVQKINNFSAESVLPINLQNMINKNQNKEIIFEGDIYVPAIEIDQLSYINWDNYVKHTVYKNETDVLVTANKTFQNGVRVEKLIEIKHLNGVPLSHVLRKEKDQQVKAAIDIEGDVTFEIAEVDAKINDVLVSDIFEKLFVSNRHYHLRSDVIFRRLSYIRSLKIHGKINDKDITEVFKDVAYTNKDNTFKNDIIFKEPVFISGNLAINNLFNNINFFDISSKIVLTTNDGFIDCPVIFTKTVLVQQKTIVEENLSSHLVAGYNTSEWIEKSIPLDKGFIQGHYKFEHIVIGENLFTKFVNDINMASLVPLKTNQTITNLRFKELNFVNDIPVGKTVNGINLPAEVKKTLMKDGDQRVSVMTAFKNIILVRQNLNATFLNNLETSKILTTNTDQILTSTYIFNSKTELESNFNVDGTINEVNFDEWLNNTLKINSDRVQFVCNDWTLENLTFADSVKSIGNVSGLNLKKISKEVEERKDFKMQFEHGILDDYKGICDDVTFLYEKVKLQIYKFKYFENFQQLSFTSKIKTAFYFVFNNSHYLLINLENCFTHIRIFNGTQFVPLLENLLTGQFEQVISVVDDDVLYLVTRGTKLSKCNTTKGVNIWIFSKSGLKFQFNIEEQNLLQESNVPSTFYAINKKGVTEYKIKKHSEGPIKYRKWSVFDENAAFVPRGLKTGIAVRTGRKIMFLDRTEPVTKVLDMNILSESVIKGSIRSIENRYIPGRNDGDLTVINVGIKSSRKNLLAVASHEEAVVRGAFDFVKIYEDPLTGTLFDKVATYKPSSLLSIEFEQGETLLVFLENKRILQIYEYKGIEGFEHRTSVKLEASSLFKMNLPTIKDANMRKAIGVIQTNQIKILSAVMDGNKISEDLNCRL